MEETKEIIAIIKDLTQILVLVLTARQLVKSKESEVKSKRKKK